MGLHEDEFRAYCEAVRFLEGLANLPLQSEYMNDRHGPPIYLDRLRYFLDLVGNPHQGLCWVHIAGTAGKGTVAAMVHGALVAADKRAGLFTSPFPTTTVESIQVDGRYIAPGELVAIVEELKPAIDRAYVDGPYGGPSYFEVLFAVALVYFHRQTCGWAVLEAGLGGRYDATNVIESPDVTALTNVDYDHTNLLGKTLEKIAWDKAGIIKAGSHFWTSETRPTLLEIFQQVCREQGAVFHAVEGSQGGHGQRNAALAAGIGRQLGLPEAAIRHGVENVRLPCRFELVQQKPALLLDGAHSAVKMGSTAAQLDALSFRCLHLVIGIAQDKDGPAILARIVPQADALYVTRFELKERKCAHPVDLAAEAQKHQKPGVPVAVYLDPRRALTAALAAAADDDLILVTGSFFLAGELRTRWYPEQHILSTRQSF